MDSSQFSDDYLRLEGMERTESRGATSETFRVKLYGKLHFLKRLKMELAGDIRFHEAFRKEFETGYRLEHPNLVRYISMTDDGILMEYVDGETLTQHISDHPNYFKDKRNFDKFIRQLLDAVGYLHAHQVLHLDLKPDNILLTRINDDVKLIDLGCCYTDTFTDTTGHTDAYAAPEQLSGDNIDVRTDIYAIGKILRQIPHPYIYNKVIERCTAEKLEERYSSVKDIQADILHKKRKKALLPFTLMVLFIFIALGAFFNGHQKEAAQEETVAVVANHDTMQRSSTIIPQDISQQATSPQEDLSQQTTSPQVDVKQIDTAPKPSSPDELSLLKKDMEKRIDKAYQAIIATFCDSVFPSPTVGVSWKTQSTAFHNEILQICNNLHEKYPTVSETLIFSEAETRFQNLITFVFNKMRKNGELSAPKD